jgi:DNA helicase-2/ATP-dependent DNA helicase PcrA
VYKRQFKNWYLQNDINQESKKNEYVEFLWQVNDLITSILKEKETELMLLDHFLEIVKEYQLNQLNISSKIPDMTKNINLLTAHKAKGLEFEKVFVIGCSKGKWSSSKSKEIIKFPINLPIDSLPENNDDFLRLLFVAITRAKTDLVFTNTIDIEKKDTQWIISLQKAFEENGIEIQKPKVDVNLETILPAIFEKNFSQALDVSKVFEEQDLLGLLNTILDKYKMSASDLTMYLDIVRSGPISLLEKKILKFPSSSSLQQEVGTLIHGILFEYYLIWNKQQSQAQIEDLIAILDKKIQKYTVKKQDKEKLYYVVSKNLHLYNEQKIKHWVKGSEVEKDFTKMDVVLDYEEVRVPLTGKIDRLDFDHQNKLITIVDYKSGKPFSSWEPETDKKISSWNYRLQLYFYKILVECSGVYPDYQIKSAKLEFLKPEAQTDILYTLDLEYDDFETERVKKLITKVYSKIITKDFPIFNEKSKSYKRVLKFEADILGEPSEFVDKLEEDN